MRVSTWLEQPSRSRFLAISARTVAVAVASVVAAAVAVTDLLLFCFVVQLRPENVEVFHKRHAEQEAAYRCRVVEGKETLKKTSQVRVLVCRRGFFRKSGEFRDGAPGCNGISEIW